MAPITCPFTRVGHRRRPLRELDSSPSSGTNIPLLVSDEPFIGKFLNIVAWYIQHFQPAQTALTRSPHDEVEPNLKKTHHRNGI